jgi:hypothetical protein
MTPLIIVTVILTVLTVIGIRFKLMRFILKMFFSQLWLGTLFLFLAALFLLLAKSDFTSFKEYIEIIGWFIEDLF